MPICLTTKARAAPPGPSRQRRIWFLSRGGYLRADLATPALVTLAPVAAGLDAAGTAGCSVWGWAALAADGLLPAAIWPAWLPGEESTATVTPAAATHRHTADTISTIRRELPGLAQRARARPAGPLLPSVAGFEDPGWLSVIRFPPHS